MKGKVFLNLAILCGILSQGINANFSEQGESSDTHVRKKRVIYRRLNHPKVTIREAPFIVNIKKNNENHCVGAILSENVVITVGHTVMYDNISAYKVYSGHEDINAGQVHNVEKRLIYHGIALLEINPGFRFSRNRQPIEIEDRPIPAAGANGIVYGWGSNIGPPVRFHQILRAIEVPILTSRECAHVYQGRFQIRDEHICTRDPATLRYNGPGDYGAPLIYLNKLVGIYLWSEESPSHFNPDVYINLQPPQLRLYINEFKHRVEAEH